MGYIPDMARISTDSQYADQVFHNHIQTGNVSVFDRSAFCYATAMVYESAEDVLVDNVIEIVSTLERVHHALRMIECDAWEDDDLLTCDCTIQTLCEVEREIRILDAWLEAL